MNCAYAAHLLIVTKNYQPFLENRLIAEKTEQGNNTLLDIEKTFPFGPLEEHGTSNFWVQVAFGRPAPRPLEVQKVI
jgi:hypothetical protein